MGARACELTEDGLACNAGKSGGLQDRPRWSTQPMTESRGRPTPTVRRCANPHQ